MSLEFGQRTKTMSTLEDLYDQLQEADAFAVSAVETMKTQNRVIHKLGDEYQKLKHGSVIKRTKAIDYGSTGCTANNRRMVEDALKVLAQCGFKLDDK